MQIETPNRLFLLTNLLDLKNGKPHDSSHNLLQKTKIMNNLLSRVDDPS